MSPLMVLLLPHKLKFGLAMFPCGLDSKENRLSPLSDLTSVGPQDVLFVF